MDKKLIGLATLFFLVFAIFISTIILNSSGLRNSARASEEEKNVSLGKSLILAYPLRQVKADGKTKSVINVFLKSEKELVIKNTKVAIRSAGVVGMISGPSEMATNDLGQAVFYVVSSAPGTMQIEAFLPETQQSLVRKISVQFE